MTINSPSQRGSAVTIFFKREILRCLNLNHIMVCTLTWNVKGSGFDSRFWLKIVPLDILIIEAYIGTLMGFFGSLKRFLNNKWYISTKISITVVSLYHSFLKLISELHNVILMCKTPYFSAKIFLCQFMTLNDHPSCFNKFFLRFLYTNCNDVMYLLI